MKDSRWVVACVGTLLLLGFAVSAVAAKSLIVAAIGSAAILAFLALGVAGVRVWYRSWNAMGQVPRWRFSWILDPAGLSAEGKAARLWLLRVYGTLIGAGLIAYLLQRLGLS